MKPRALAILVLARVEATDAYLNVVLDAALDEHRLKDPRDAALVTELCYGATRRQLTLDSLIARYSDRKLSALEDRVLAALRIGAYQRFYTRVPARAAVAETVEALKELGLARATGFVNAVLRKIVALPEVPLPPEKDGVRHWSLRESHPEWLVERWFRQLGAERATAMLQADNEAPRVVVRANGSKLSRDELLAQLRDVGVEAEPTSRSPKGIVLQHVGRVEELFGYAEGLFQVQDEAAQLVGVYAAIPDGARVLDCCAAPGGKTCHLAEQHEVVAIDLHANKLPKIHSELRRLGLEQKAKTYAHDATKPLPSEWGAFDAVLVDAPCSGLGTLRRHPELRYRRKPEDVVRLAELQREILENVKSRVAPGGLLVYALCTTEPEEGPEQVNAFLARNPEFTLEPPTGVDVPLDGPFLRTLPGPEGMDGFFAARLRSRSR